VSATIAEALVMPREAWGAAEARDPYEPVGALRALVLHHTSRPSDDLLEADIAAEAAHLRFLQACHFDRGWSDLGYHFVIVPSGRVFLGRPPSALGAHVKGWNRGTLAICLAGDFDLHPPTPAALQSLSVVRNELVPQAGLPLVGHCDLAPKRCPGRFLREYTDHHLAG
jgi:N-acetylmuramoyl-L-alanine amidase